MPELSPPATRRSRWRSWGRGPASVSPRIFYPAAALVTLFVVYAALFTDHATNLFSSLHNNVISSFGWFYAVVVAGFVVFAVVIGVSRLGDVTLGPDDEEPEFGLGSWLSMLFAAGMGIGLVFWGVAEPVSHLVEPRPGSVGDRAAEMSDTTPWYAADNLSAQAADASQEAMIQTYLHWGLHPWAIYAVIGLGVAYAIHRKGRPVSIRWALEPVLGRYVRGWLGDVIDIVAVVGTLIGVATSLSLGVLQIAAGVGIIGDVDVGTLWQVILVIGITLIATASVVSGVARGIRWLSNINVSLMVLLLIFVLVTGPTLFLLREFIQSTGLYVQNLFRLSFDVGAERGQPGQAWTASWSIFYWGWWMSWAPFVGVFIARISRGRTVKQFVAGVLLVPSLVSFLWFAILGGTGLNQEQSDPGRLAASVERGEEFVLFEMLDGLPAATAVSIGVLVLITLFFVTSSDSASLVVDMLSSGGDPNPPVWSRVFWALLEGAVAAVLLVLAAGGLEALQTAAILAALPVSLVLIVMCVSIWRNLRAERLALLRAQRRRRTEELTEAVSQRLGNGNGNGNTAGER